MEFFEKFLSDTENSRALEAALYTLRNAGKRIRPNLVFKTAALFDVYDENVERIACAVELIHNYSLIHDDLPCMDDDDFRRGKPSCHKVFGEGTAVLAGDGLLNLAAEVLCGGLCGEKYFKAMGRLFSRTGFNGMIGGQSCDIDEKKQNDESTLLFLTERKTVRLFEAAMLSAADYCGADGSQTRALGDFAKAFGFAFQIKDDLLDEGTEPDKLTFVSVYGERAKALLREYSLKAEESMSLFKDKSGYFVDLVKKNLDRQ